jgi:alkylation response protein AidB-like acyl-CoA dehydrogenase
MRARDVALLRDSGYLTLAVPARLGGAGLNLRQVACAQRRLAARAPGAALAVIAHHACVGAAADTLACAPGDAAGPVAERLLGEAAQGRFFAGGGPGALGRGPGALGCGPCDPREDTLAAGTFGWGLPLAGMTYYAIARHAFERATDLATERATDLATERAANRAQRRADGDHAGGRHDPGHALDQWPVAEAALRLDGIRGQLDEVIEDWQQRTAAGGALTRLDPGGQWLIRLFTVRHGAADGARRVAELAAQIAEPAGLVGPLGPVGCARPVWQ